MHSLNVFLRFYHSLLNKINRSVRLNLQHPDLVYQLNFYQRNILNNDIMKANVLLKPYKRLYQISWKCVFFKTVFQIENNFPHTNYDTIFLTDAYFSNSESNRINTLIHEKIHIYQRFYPIPYNKILLNFYNLNIKSLLRSHSDFDHVRINPDNNLLIYDDQGHYTLQLFRKNPKSLSDVYKKQYGTIPKSKYSNLPNDEHPNETTAYYFTDMIMNQRKLPPEVTNLL